ncbi:MAG: endo-1,4-beta-xylanase [Acetatifactor sp.]|nr:endo-1,4-beta-xylanase [Acetatifactor sp.]
MKRKILCALVLTVALSITGCGSVEEPSVQSSEVVTSSVPSSEAETPESSEEIVAEPALSEEEIYWLDELQKFKDSPYDLTAALYGQSLKDLCSKYFTLGVGINGSTLENQTLNMPEYMEVCRKHFNSCTMTNLMKSAYILDQKASAENLASGDGAPVLNFATIDPTLEWCKENDFKMRGHTLVWHAQAPEWFFREGYTEQGAYVDKETMLFRMESYIQQMLTHVQEDYPGVIYCWDVVNEAVDPDKGNKDSAFLCRMENDGTPNPWYMTIGEDYVEMAFTYARKYADPEVKLIYNDFNTFQPVKRNAIYALCESLKEKGLIDGIGMQGYWGLDYPKQLDLENTIRQYAKLDLEIQITELSVGVDTEDEASFEKQAKKYSSLFLMFRNLDTTNGGPANITNVTLFGLKDHYREGDTTNSRIFDKDYQLKPAFLRIRDTMINMYEQE